MNGSVGRIQSLKLGAAAQMLPIVAGYTANLFVTPYAVSRLGLHDFGVWSITVGLAQYAALLDLGVSRAASRYVALFHAKGDVKSEGAVVGICVTTLVILGTLLGGLSLIAAGPLDRLIGKGDPRLACLLLLCAVSTMIVSLLARVLAAASLGRGRQVSAGIGVANLLTLQAVGGAIALVVRPSLIAFALGNVAGTMLGLGVVATIILFDEHRITIGRPVAGLTREILTYGVKSQAGNAGDMLLMQSGKLIAGILVGPAAAGVYELASRLAMGAQAFGAASASALIPHLTRCYIGGGMDSVLDQYEHLTRRNTAVSIFIPFLMAATAFSAIPLWLGGDNGRVVFVLLALLPGIAINVSTGVCTSTLMAIGKPAIIAVVTVVAGITQTAIAVALGYTFGFVGIGLAFAVGMPTAKLIGLWCMQSSMGIPMKLYIRGVRGPYAIAIIATSVSMPIGLLSASHNRESAVWPFLASTALFCVIYALLGWGRGYLPQLPLPRRRSRVSVQDQESN